MPDCGLVYCLPGSPRCPQRLPNNHKGISFNSWNDTFIQRKWDRSKNFRHSGASLSQSACGGAVLAAEHS